jgi:cytochrome c553
MQWVLRLIVMIGALLCVGIPMASGAPDIEAGRRKAQVCTECHGVDGNSTNPTIPSLAAQPPLYTFYQLIQFREGRRKDPQMSPFAAHLSDAEMQDLAAYYAVQQPASAASGEPDSRKMDAGQQAVERHYCASCHAPGLIGQDQVPRLAGQHYAYLLKQLHGFKAQTSADLDGSMTTAAQALSDREIEALAHYIAQLRSAPARAR